MRVVLLTAAALVGFSANSLLTRAALGTGEIDAATFTFVRLLSGALMLSLLVRIRSGATQTAERSWAAALLLAAYAILFTIAYGRIGASVGALLLFGAVQIAMMGAGLRRGERPAAVDWLGIALALAGLIVLTLPGATAPDAWGAALMGAAGVCWGSYSLAGRTAGDPLARTARNFARATPFAAIFLAATIGQRHLTVRGLLLAAASGSLASGVGYSLWYQALPFLPAWRAALVQLLVPVATAVAASVLLGEPITVRLAGATLLVSLGVGLAIWPRPTRAT